MLRIPFWYTVDLCWGVGKGHRTYTEGSVSSGWNVGLFRVVERLGILIGWRAPASHLIGDHYLVSYLSDLHHGPFWGAACLWITESNMVLFVFHSLDLYPIFSPRGVQRGPHFYLHNNLVREGSVERL